MIPAFIVLTVVACALGGYIAFDILRGRKEVLTAEEIPETAEQVLEEEVEESALPEIPPEQAEEDGGDDDVTEVKPVIEDGKTKFIVIKYGKSFLAKLIQSEEQTKEYYSEIKNALFSYDGVKSRISWKREAFRFGRITLARLSLRGKTLSLCLALDPEDYSGGKYRIDSLAGIKSFADTPCLYRLKNDRRVKYGRELISEVMKKHGVKAGEKQTADYAAQYPYESTDALIGRKLIKVLTDEDAQSGTAFKPKASVTVREADSLMRDEVAATLISNSDTLSDRTRTSIINIDVLSRYFEDGERVTLEEVIKRVPEISGKTTYLKVLGRGTLDKKLIVEADSFSLQAVKMIVLTGGTAIKKR